MGVEIFGLIVKYSELMERLYEIERYPPYDLDGKFRRWNIAILIASRTIKNIKTQSLQTELCL